MPPGSVVVVMLSAAGGGAEDEEDDDDDDDDDEEEEEEEEDEEDDDDEGGGGDVDPDDVSLEPPPHEASAAAHAIMPAISNGVIRRGSLHVLRSDLSRCSAAGKSGPGVAWIGGFVRAEFGRAKRRLMATSSMVRFTKIP
ncbi:MAG: hypothetical protein ACREUG_15295 [Steroidobacteraceae bacterium]